MVVDDDNNPMAAGTTTGSFEPQTIDDTTIEVANKITIDFTISQGLDHQ
ncbi:hypothetical protein N7U66_07450 [Lacinutrix neustonica]|uniref:Uncharacterized protein n=1 Tax=Lacinutrix neustonica TaxID=2980107 RepID=A0A9E8MYI4_9FLAO|nr:hypothetical protein [Lacinutrix neustonica]WAC03361.1 hypothetical protein N7U66_07450 [Lacinutrix neustonica]